MTQVVLFSSLRKTRGGTGPWRGALLRVSLFAALLFWPGVGTLAGTETCTYLTCCPTTGTIDVDVMANTTCDPTGLGTDCPGSAVCDHTVDILTSNYRITLTGSCASAVRRMLVCQAWVDVQTSMAVCGPTCSEVNELTNGAGNNTPTTRASLTCDPATRARSSTSFSCRTTRGPIAVRARSAATRAA